MHVTCAWCGDDISRDPALAGPAGAGLTGSGQVTHGICDACAAALLNQRGTPLGQFLASLPVPTLLVTGNVEVEDLNEAGAALLATQAEDVAGRLIGEVFECVNADLPEGCGRTVHCSGCTLRRTVEHTYHTGETALRVPASLRVRSAEDPRDADLYITTARVGDKVLLRVDPAGDSPTD